MKYLLDINLLLALAHQDHADHQKASRWFQSVSKTATGFHTCSISELGFVRVGVQAGLNSDISSARQTLIGMKQSSHVPFTLLPDALDIVNLPKYVKTPAQLTDGHLLQLALSAGAKFATLDKGIPGSLVVS